MIDMTGNNVNLGDKVIYSARCSKKLVIGYLVREIGSRKGVVSGTPDALQHYIRYIEKWNKEYQEKYPNKSNLIVDPVKSFTGDKIVTPDQIYKIM